jgi:hypothetical protein
MRDVDHADAAAPQAAHPLEQTLDLVGRQARGRLVEHEEIATDDERAGDRDEQLFRPAQASHPSAWVDLADQRERLLGRQCNWLTGPTEGKSRDAAPSGQRRRRPALRAEWIRPDL